MKILDNRVIEVNDLISRFFNMDFDGDSMISLAVHSKQAREDAINHMFVKNIIEFDHADELLIDFEHETIYSAYMLSYEAKKEFEKLIQEPENLKDLKELTPKILDEIGYNQFIKLYSLFHKAGIPYAKFNNKPVSYFEIIINKLLGTIDFKNKEMLYTFEKYGLLTKKNLNKLIYNFFQKLKKEKKENEFWDIIHNFNKFFLEAGTRLSPGVASFDFEDFAVHSESIEKFKEDLIQNEPFLAFHQNLILFDNLVVPEIEKNEYNFLNTLYKSGARLKSVQLLKAASNVGIPTNIYGKAFPVNIKHSLLDGLTKEEYFTSGDSARLALAQRQDAIPKGGELQRKFFFSTGIIKQADLEDCATVGDVRYFEIEIPNKDILKVLKYRWYLNEETGKEELINGNEEHLIGKTIKLRSPITCQAPDYKVCKKCLGEKRPTTANLGAPIGQYLSEAIIQSILRTHHYGGAFLADIDQKIIEILGKAKIEAQTDYTIIESDKEDIEYIKDFLYKKYKEGIELTEEEIDDKIKLKIVVHSLPFSEDAVKLLRETSAIIDKNSSSIDIKKSFLKLAEISAYNGILNVYFELVLSILFYDEDDVLYRYSNKEPVKQLALKEVIENIDPKLTIFYNFSNKTIQKIFSTKSTFKVDHMYRDLIEIYK